MAAADMQNESSTMSGILNMAISFTVTGKCIHWFLEFVHHGQLQKA
jgi:hypothetical protein